MSLRYTGEATMDEPALRDVERWKDKIEVRLDNRQVFFLFFGSAMVACMLFVLGVIVGKRLETRGRAEAPAVEDPLAMLDRFAVALPAPVPAPLTFPHALIGTGSSKMKPTLAATTAVAAVAAPPPVAAVSAPAAPAARTVAPVPMSTSAPASTTAGASTSAARAAPTVNATATVAAKRLAALPRPLPTTQVSARSIKSDSAGATATPAASREPVATTKTGAATSTSAVSASAPAEKAKGHFLLQLSSFQDRGEAETFARRFAGQNAYVVASEIPGKGTWFRVRVGSYGTLQEATAAKTAFERDHNVIAYVAGAGPAK